MEKYFKEEQSVKISLSDYWSEIKKEYEQIEEDLKKYSTGVHVSHEVYSLILKLGAKKRELSLKYSKIKHIYKSLGDVQISEDMIEVLCETLRSSKCRYGTICLKSATIKTMYELSEIFPELSKEALILISREYIKDLFDKYSLVETLAIMIRKEGMEDSTFEKFMDTVIELADKENKKYDIEASYIRMFYGEYTYNFIMHFEKFMKEHHITYEQFSESLPEVELILKDELQLKAIEKSSKDCWSGCAPITYQMLEDYLDGDTELSYFDEQPSYYVSTVGRKMPTTFTKTQFLESIKKQQKVLKRK